LAQELNRGITDSGLDIGYMAFRDLGQLSERLSGQTTARAQQAHTLTQRAEERVFIVRLEVGGAWICGLV
jgi:hypothetical protein